MKTLLTLFLIILVLAGYSQKEESKTAPLHAGPMNQLAAFSDTSRYEKLKPVLKHIDRMFVDHARKNNIPAIAYGVVLDGKLIYSGASGYLNVQKKVSATNRSLFRIASMTKGFTAMAIMILNEKQALSLDAPAENIIPELKGMRYLTKDAKPITIRNLLTMSAGFPEDNPWGDRQLNDTDKDLLDLLRQGVSFSNNPGQAFEYSNLGYAILGQIITRVSGMPYEKFIDANIIRPLGMHDTRWEYSEVKEDRLAHGYRWEDEQWKEEPMLHHGAYGAMGGLITSIEDFAKYVSLHLQAYPPSDAEDKGPLSRHSIREMHKPYMPALYPEAKSSAGELCPVMGGYGFGLGFRQDCKGVKRISHGGGLPGFGSDWRFYPDYGIGIVSFANRTYAGTGGIDNRVMDTLMLLTKLKPREVVLSATLEKRRDQLISFLKTWTDNPAQPILAENFFLDQSGELRMRDAKKVFDTIGKIMSYQPVIPENQLRGSFDIIGEKGVAKVFFTLTPEKDPKVQQLDIWIPEE
jgi:CubicO group peptidase (beta-lactamase class C family)